MVWVVCYDIPDNRRRAKIAKLMEGYGRRAQYSVFECDISEEKRAKLEGLLRRVLNEDEDDLRMYPLNQADIKRVIIVGRGELNRDKPVQMIGFDLKEAEEGDHPF